MNESLTGSHVRLEPLRVEHIEPLVEASAADPSLYDWSIVPQGSDQMHAYVAAALSAKDAGTALPYAIVRLDDGRVIGTTRFFDMERWSWPADHPRHGRTLPDVCEIGYTWLTRSAIRTAANTDAKRLMLTHAFEMWDMLRVCLHTDARNERSRAAMERIGARFEGVLRSHRIAIDRGPRDSARYSIVAAEWPAIKERLRARK